VPLERQLVIFSADSARPSTRDLAGLLVGAAHVTTMGGTARISVTVDAAWRVHALAAEFATRGLSLSWEHAQDSFLVRTSYSTSLRGLNPPSFLDGCRLRLWFTAAGRLDGESVVLNLDNNHALARRALAPLGLDGEIERGPAIRIEGAAKVARLADLIGHRPKAAPEAAWPKRTEPERPERAAVLVGAGRPVRSRRAERHEPAERLV
jgi:hypothetical protein